jgi:hypothetical protein
MDIWNKAGLRKTRYTGLGKKSIKLRKVEGGVSGGKSY